MSNPTIEVTEGGVELPVVDVLTGRGAIFGKSGSGKSNTVGVIAEELLEQNFPLLIVDADGEHYSLKEEYQLLHAGADSETCDVAVGPEHGEALAHLALDEGVPLILDVSDYIDRDEADALVREVVHSLYRLEKTREVPFPIFVEEAHEYIPESGSTDETGEALIKVGRRGRKRGLGLVTISQRPANVNKDFVTQADWRIWHTLTWRNDTQVVRDVLGPEHANAVQDLDPGEGLIDADWEPEVRSVQFKRKRTFDLGETPGLEDFQRPELQPVDEEVLSTLMEITEEEAEEEDRVAQLEAEKARLEATVADLEAELERAESGESPEQSELVEDLREKNRALRSDLEQVQSDLEEAQATIEDRNEQIEELRDEVADLRSVRDDLEEVRTHFQAAQEVLGMGESDDALEEYRERVETLEHEVDRLEEEAARLRESEDVVTIPSEYSEFYEHSTVEEAIEATVQDSNASQKAIWATILTIADLGGPATYDEIAERGGYADNTQVSKAVSSLEGHGVLEEVDTNPKKVDFNFGEMAEIERKNKIREEMDERIEQKVSRG